MYLCYVNVRYYTPKGSVMRVILSILALSVSFMMQAQDKSPKMEKAGDQVKATYYHDNGEVAQVGYFLSGKLNGEWKMYDAAGKKIAMGQYDQGVKVGKWFFWEEDGLKEVDYEDNRIAAVVKWNQGEAVVLNNK